MSYVPRTKQVYWCNCCDIVKVDSEDKATGRFYLQAGHCYTRETQEYDGDYEMVMFALCPSCDQQEVEQDEEDTGTVAWLKHLGAPT